MSDIRHAPLAPTHVLEQAGGDVIDRHRHDEHQLIYVSTGVLAITTAAGSWVAAPDRAVWVPAGTWHEHRFFGASRFHTVGFATRGAPLPRDEPVVIVVDDLLRELVIACTDEDLRADENRRLRRVLHDRLPRAAVQSLRLPTPHDPRLADACREVAGDLSRPLSLADLARRVGVGGRTLSRLFRVEFGTSYPQWRAHLRVFHAMTHLAAGDSVTLTAQRCGFATPSAFVDTFTRVMGQTPGTYRKAARGPRRSRDSAAGEPRPARRSRP